MRILAWRHFEALEKIKILFILLLKALSNLLDLIGILLIGAVASALSGSTISPKSQMGTLISTIDELQLGPSLLIIAVAACFFFVTKSATAIFLNHVFNKNSSRIQARLAKLIFQRWLDADIRTARKISQPEFISGISTSLFSFTSQNLSIFSNVISEGLLILTIAIVLLVSDTTLFLALAAILVLLAFALNRFLVVKIASNSAEKIDNLLKLQSVLKSDQEAYKQIAVSSGKRFLTENFHDLARRMAQLNARSSELTFLPRHIIELTLILVLTTLLILRSSEGFNAFDGQVVGLFLVGSLRLFSSFLTLQGNLNDLKALNFESGPAKKMIDLLETPPHFDGGNQTTEPNLDEPAYIEAVNLDYGFNPDKNYLFANLTFSANPGEFIAVLGKSGSGKSTFTDILSGLVCICDEADLKVSGLCPYVLRTKFPGYIGYVPQRVQLLEGGLIENLALASSSSIHLDRIENVLNLVGLEELEISEYEVHGNNGNELKEMSGGQLQRLGIARALLQQPKLLILDEPTSSQDSYNQRKIVSSLHAERKKFTLVVVAHRLETVDLADQFIVFGDDAILVTRNFSEAKAFLN